jgi:hypothetical protein
MSHVGTAATDDPPTHRHALIAEDEPLLAPRWWPSWPAPGHSCACWPPSGDGESAVTQALRCNPTCCFLTSACPARAGWTPPWPWPTTGHGEQAKPFPALVFVTAYDQYAVQAFERRRWTTCSSPCRPSGCARRWPKLQQTLAQRADPAARPGRHAGPADATCWATALTGAGTGTGGAAPAPGAAPLKRHPGQRGHQHPHGAGGRRAGL